LIPAGLLVLAAIALAVHTMAPRSSVASDSTTIQWQTRCVPSHVANDDPIVFPDQPGASHDHVFFGNMTTDADSTGSSLLNAVEDGRRQTSCEDRLDGSAYWVPALYRCAADVPTCDKTTGERVDPRLMFTYFARPDNVTEDVNPFPVGFEVIAGNPAATSPQPTQLARWRCSTDTIGRSVPPTPDQCPGNKEFILRITFPSCWDGVLPQGRQFSEHVSYPVNGACPDDFPKRLPTLWLGLRYPNDGLSHTYAWASGSIYSAHADFLNAWQPAEMSRLTDDCLQTTPRPCGIVRTSPTGQGFETPADL
jgi:hypothetical protein